MNRRIMAWALVLFAGSAILFLALSLRPRQGGGDGALSDIRRRGVIRVGYAIEPPYAFLSGTKEVDGQSPALAKYVCERLGVARIEWRLYEFGALIDALIDGNIDMIAAGMFITPQRSRLVRFSLPIFHVRQGLLVAKGNPRRLHSYVQALADPWVKIAVLSGSVEETLLRRIGFPDGQLVPVPDAETGLQAVGAGVADGFALSSPSINWMVMRQAAGATERAVPFEQPSEKLSGALGYGAFAFRKEDASLAEAVDAELAAFLPTPRYLGMIARYGFTVEESPGEADPRENPRQ